jgi:hypothetical protein
MAKGISIHIGLNRVDPEHYSGWEGVLGACESDATDMQEIAKNNGFTANILLSEHATRKAVISNIKKAAQSLVSGDILFISYSGHGGQLPDRNNDEPDGQDETWCLYDSQLIDDELHELWAEFSPGIRILVISDSCHSGTMTKAAISSVSTPIPNYERSGKSLITRNLPGEIANRVYRKNQAFYDKIAKELPEKKSVVNATVLLLSGCQDNQLSYDGTFNGEFTRILLGVWNEGRFKGDYVKFHKRIVEQLPSYQTPNLFHIGSNPTSFMEQRPFKI